MPADLLGRTNRAFPPVWLSLTSAGTADAEGRERLVRAAIESKVPIDISGGAGLFGGAMRGTDAFLTAVGTSGYERANDDRHASDLIQAHLIETLSAIGREHIDVYYLRVRRVVDEMPLSGALEALEMAKQEGHIRFLGIACDGHGMATLGTWQFHDAFELLRVPRSRGSHEAYDTLLPVAKERRVGVVTTDPFDGAWDDAAIAQLSREHPIVVPVGTEDEVRRALEAGA